jgi:hypothetical protein
MTARKLTVSVSAHHVAEPAALDSEAEVQRRMTTGELVRHAPGSTPVREHVVAQLRAHMARPREKPKA